MFADALATHLIYQVQRAAVTRETRGEDTQRRSVGISWLLLIVKINNSKALKERKGINIYKHLQVSQGEGGIDFYSKPHLDVCSIEIAMPCGMG